jgi:hypothetical protein
MSNTIILRNLLRAVILMAIQVLVLKNIQIGGTEYNYFTLFLYPIFLMFLPLETPTWLMIIIGFFYGICIDIPSDSIGIHAAACTFSGFSRSFLLGLMEPQGGYKEGSSPTRRRMGFIWFLRYSFFFMLGHIFFYFCVEEFTLFYIGRILLFTFPSFVLSYILVIVYSFLFDPTE